VCFVVSLKLSFCNCFWLTVCISVVVLCVLLSYVYLLYCVGIAFFTLDAGLLARSQYSECPANCHFERGLSWFPLSKSKCRNILQDSKFATSFFSCSPTDLNFVITNFLFFTCEVHLHRVKTQLQ